ncbi:MAG: WD40 repeat domain-containing protein, partial [Bacteroidales bacterium]|nr:WD40 repeat domain-containing protein [Bacteroidales bacterium]
WDMSIVLWNPNNGRNLQTLKGHTFSVESLCWTPDGKYLISGAGDQTVRIWSKETEYIYIDVPFPDKKPERDVVNEERDVVKEDSKPENGVETEQAQIEKPAKKVIKKSIEKTRDDNLIKDDEILIKEYDQQGNIIKITDIYCSDCPVLEFTFKDGKIFSAKGGNEGYCEASVNKQKNTATYCLEGGTTEVEFNEFGYKKAVFAYEEGEGTGTYEYNKDGLLVKVVRIFEDDFEGTSSKTTTTYTYDVMSQDWTKRTGKDNKGYKTVTTRTVEYW